MKTIKLTLETEDETLVSKLSKYHSYRAEFRTIAGYRQARFAANTTSMEIATRAALQLCGEGEQLIGVVREGLVTIIDVVDGGAA